MVLGYHIARGGGDEVNAKTFVCAFIGTVGGFVANLVGGFSEDVLTLILFMAIDYITGLITHGNRHRL